MQENTAIGALIGVAFALGWALAGAAHATGGWSTRIRAAAVVVTLLLGGAVLWRWHVAPARGAAAAAGNRGGFDGAAYGWAVAFESVAIPVAAVLLGRLGRRDLLLPAVALIVGVHFFGLARALGGSLLFLATGAVMCALALFAGWRCAWKPSRSWGAVVGLGCAVLLWLSALATIL